MRATLASVDPASSDRRPRRSEHCWTIAMNVAGFAAPVFGAVLASGCASPARMGAGPDGAESIATHTNVSAPLLAPDEPPPPPPRPRLSAPLTIGMVDPGASQVRSRGSTSVTGRDPRRWRASPLAPRPFRAGARRGVQEFPPPSRPEALGPDGSRRSLDVLALGERQRRTELSLDPQRPGAPGPPSRGAARAGSTARACRSARARRHGLVRVPFQSVSGRTRSNRPSADRSTYRASRARLPDDLPDALRRSRGRSNLHERTNVALAQDDAPSRSEVVVQNRADSLVIGDRGARRTREHHEEGLV